MYAHVHLQTQMHQTKLQFFLSNQFKFHTKTNARVNKIKDAKKEYFDNDQKNKDKGPKKRLNDCDCK